MVPSTHLSHADTKLWAGEDERKAPGPRGGLRAAGAKAGQGHAVPGGWTEAGGAGAGARVCELVNDWSGWEHASRADGQGTAPESHGLSQPRGRGVESRTHGVGSRSGGRELMFILVQEIRGFLSALSTPILQPSPWGWNLRLGCQ